MSDFVEFQKIARLSRRCIVTEKIDGTNAQVFIRESVVIPDNAPVVASHGGMWISAGSRNQYITPDKDNFGFAAWVRDNAEALSQLGPGRHYGEWFGSGIQRGYGLKEKRFALFNTHRWGESHPACCHAVPVLYDGIFGVGAEHEALRGLAANGSRAVPGFMRPEGIVIWHDAAGMAFKKTIEKDEAPKGRPARAVDVVAP